MLKSRLPQIAAALPIVVDRAVRAGADVVAADAEERLRPHHRSGELEAAVHVDDRKREGIYVVAGELPFAFYGHILEFGSSHAPPYPFLVPALEDNRDWIVNLVDTAVSRLGL